MALPTGLMSSGRSLPWHMLSTRNRPGSR